MEPGASREGLQAVPLEAPAMSIILGTPDCFATIATTIGYLANQTVAHQLEIVMVCPDANALGPDSYALAPFHSWRVVKGQSRTSLAAGYAAGVPAARGAIVALGEDHSFPEPGWAAALIERHRGPWAAVGPILKNANPENGVSWADMLMAYAPWIYPNQAGPADYLPGHNSSYKREVLLALGDQLEHFLNAEFVLHAHLRAQGLRLYLETQAVTRHTNYARWGAYLAMHLVAGRCFAATRASDWNGLKRLVYFGASPLIPLVRWRRIWKQVAAARFEAKGIRGCRTALICGLISSALGEAVGYALGMGESRARLAYYESHRYRHTLSGNYAAAPMPAAAAVTVR